MSWTNLCAKHNIGPPLVVKCLRSKNIPTKTNQKAPPRLTQAQKQAIIHLYQSGATFDTIQQTLGASSKTVYKLLEENGIARRGWHPNSGNNPQCRPKLSDATVDRLIKNYQAGYPIDALCKVYKIQESTLFHYLQRRNIKPNRGSNAHIDFFNSIDTELKAYWLGFVAADGCVWPQSNSLRVGLSRTDYVHLCRLRDALGVRNRIYWTRPRTKNKRHNVSVLDVRSEGMIADLLALGIKQNKTYNLEWPTIPPNLEHHFIRGYFDGDGSWWIIRGPWRPNLSFECIGTWSFIKSLQDRLVTGCQLQHTKLKRHHTTSSVCTVNYGGNLQCLRIANYLYEDATIYLTRKRDIVLKHYHQFPEYYQQLRFSRGVA